MRRERFTIIFTSVLISKAEKLELLIILLSLSFSHSLLTPAACHILAKGSTVKIRVANGAPITIQRKEVHRRLRQKGNSTVLSTLPEQTKVEQHLHHPLVQLIRSRIEHLLFPCSAQEFHHPQVTKEATAVKV